jgi:hypothetical protein
MTSTLPPEVQDVFGRFVTTEYTTLDRRGQPITWPVTPYYRPGGPCIDVTTGLGYPRKARDAQANPHVALLFSDPTGCGLEGPPAVLVQGIADVDDRDLDANRERYGRESLEKLGAEKSVARTMKPPDFLMRFFHWYYTRIYVHVRPERIYVWPEGDFSREPQLLDAHLEEVRSGHSQEPEAGPAQPEGGGAAWDERMHQLGGQYDRAVLSFVSPDGFPFSARVPVEPNPDNRRVRLSTQPVGAPLQPGLACLTAHDHAPDFSWQRNFQVRGDLVEDADGWSVVPHKLVGGMEFPPGSALSRYRQNLGKMRRWRRTAKRELARSGG